MIDTEKYQPVRQNMKFVIRSLRSLTKKTSYAGSAGWYFRNQSIPIHITYTNSSIYIYLFIFFMVFDFTALDFDWLNNR